MTQNFSQPAMPWSPGGAQDKTTTDPPAPLHWSTFKLPASDPDFKRNGGQFNPDEVIGWEVKIDDLRSGYLQVGDFARGGVGAIGFDPHDGDYHGTSFSTLDQRFRRHLILPSLSTGDDLAAGWANAVTASYSYASAKVQNQLFISAGAGSASHSLASETSPMDPTLTTITIGYASSNDVVGLWPIVQGGATVAQRILHSRKGLAPHVLGLTGTDIGAMHANLTTCYGMVQSPINATTPGTGTNGFYANGGIWASPITDAVGTAPTQILSNVPNGGASVGIQSLINDPRGALRWYMLWPIQDSAGGATYFSNGVQPIPCRVVSVNLEFTDPYEEPIDIQNIVFADFWQRQLVVANATRVVVWDGTANRDLKIFANRQADSDFKYQLGGIGSDGNVLYALVQKVDMAQVNAALGGAGALGNTTMWLEMYSPALDAWIPCSGLIPNTASGSIMIACASGEQNSAYTFAAMVTCRSTKLVFSPQTSNVHVPSWTPRFWQRQFLAPPNLNPFWNYRQTGASANASQSFAVGPLTWTSPYFELPQLEGRWKRADQVVFMGDVDAGGTAAKVEITINPNQGGTAIPFVAGVTDAARVAQTADTGDDAYWMQLQVSIALTRGSTTTQTPNGLPVVIRGRAYMVDPTGGNDGLPAGL